MHSLFYRCASYLTIFAILFSFQISILNAQSTAPSSLIRTVVLEKQEVCPGESFWVVVRAVQEDNPTQPIAITIDGIPGNLRQMEFTGIPGPRYIAVGATTSNGQAESQLVKVMLKDCGAVMPYPIVTTRPNPYHSLTTDFEVMNVEALKQAGVNISVFEWDFGDGQSAQSQVPYVSHSYRDSLDINQSFTNFQAELRIRQQDQTDLVASKTVTVWNMYFFGKLDGMIEPPSLTSQQLKADGDLLHGQYMIKNLENEPIQIVGTKLETQPCNIEEGSGYADVDNFISTIEARQEINGEISLPVTSIAPDICGLTYHINGNTPSGIKVSLPLYFQVRSNSQMLVPVTDVALSSQLNQLAEQGLTADRDEITEEELYQLEREGSLPVVAGLATASGADTTQISANIGEICRPEDSPPRLGLACQATNEWENSPAYIANAKKGDIILTSACGFIGGILRRVDPAQHYSHSMLMTENYYQVTHSTSEEARYSEERYIEKDDIGVFPMGIREDILKYGWPGIITQSVGNAFGIEYRTDPESGKQYTISGSSHPVRCPEDQSTIYPQVVKPPLEWEAATRPILRAVADHALEVARNGGHYRFGNYSDGTLSEVAAPDAKWAAGTLPSVCSSFIWRVLKEKNITLEGTEPLDRSQLEPGDLDPNVRVDVDGSTRDGLYLYTEPERQAAATFLYSTVHNKVHKKIGGFGEFITGLSGKIATQLAHCFAFDDCRVRPPDLFDDDRDKWKHPSIGRAVSPDDIMRWDAPPVGVYGHHEDVIYIAGSYRRVYRWQPSAGAFTVRGRVLRLLPPIEGGGSGQVPVQGATVTLAGLESVTNQTGEFEFQAVPGGQYEIEAQAGIDNVFYYSSQLLQISADATIDLNLTTDWLQKGQGSINISRAGQEFGEPFVVNLVPPPLSGELPPFPSPQTYSFEHCFEKDKTKIVIDVTFRQRFSHPFEPRDEPSNRLMLDYVVYGVADKVNKCEDDIRHGGLVIDVLNASGTLDTESEFPYNMAAVSDYLGDIFLLVFVYYEKQ